jgi:DNA-binding MarR family transcriptional regulator
MSEDFPADVKEFLEQNIRSVAQVEVLLALYREPNRLWTSEEITSRLYLQREMVSELLADLVRRGFAVRTEEGYSYRPANETIGRLISRLAKLYQERRVAVTTEIFSRPIDSVKAFADAFRLREEK